mgnify:FL=1
MFTVKQLAKLAGVTRRTLHYYDEMGLLKPSRVGDNGYRYYGEDALIHLQQILLYRELDIPLEQIREIMGGMDFDVLLALERHKTALRKRIAHLENIITTVEDTIDHLKGSKAMTAKQLFDVFNEEQQEEYKKEAMEMYDPETVKASYQKWNHYSKEEKTRIGEEGESIYQDLVEAMPKGAASPEVQACIARWHHHLEYFWSPNDEQLVGLAEHYGADPRFRKNFDKLHPDLADFMSEAVKIYVARK